MDNKKPIIFCKGGGCTAKLGPDVLNHVLEKLPKGEPDPNLLVGYDSKDDAAVYKVDEHTAIVHTLDFFPPMVEDPYTFGQIAATNALSDIFAMGGRVTTALNIVCFPQTEDLNILGLIMQGGSEKVMEAGGILAGGHSIQDTDIKYGLSVTGVLDPGRILQNNTPQPGDKLILTKKLGVGLVCTAARVQSASEEALQEAVKSMTTLNKTASEIALRHEVHACTDVTGFSLLGHLHEMLDDRFSARILAYDVPHISAALGYADEFLYTAAGQRNRKYLEGKVRFIGVRFAMEELLFDPQTSGGLLLAVSPEDAKATEAELKEAGLPARIIGEVTEKGKDEITVIG